MLQRSSAAEGMEEGGGWTPYHEARHKQPHVDPLDVSGYGPT